MVRTFLMIFVFTCLFSGGFAQQKIIHLYAGKVPGSANWKQHESIFYDTAASGTGEQFIYNVTEPTLTIFPPASNTSNGTAIIVCPGGAFHVLGIDNEGYHVARWLNSLGISAFILKYRLAESVTNEPLKELWSKIGNIPALDKENAPVVPLAIADADTAMRYLRQHAKDLDIDPRRIGIMGFSAGGTVTAGLAFEYTAASRPDFIAPIYSYLGALINTTVQKDAPPLFVAAATDDGFGFAPSSVELYSKWLAAKKQAEIHIFSKGGHGFGMKKQNLPADQWTLLFRDWLKLEGFL